jgi:Domain of unknown function (DUF397)
MEGQRTSRGDEVTQQISPGPAGADPRPRVAWHKARASDANSGCVEVALLADGRVGVRDSKDPRQVALTFNLRDWSCFLDGAKAGKFDPPA